MTWLLCIQTLGSSAIDVLSLQIAQADKNRPLARAIHVIEELAFYLQDNTDHVS